MVLDGLGAMARRLRRQARMVVESLVIFRNGTITNFRGPLPRLEIYVRKLSCWYFDATVSLMSLQRKLDMAYMLNLMI
jgi:hypothetical protein